MRHWAGTACVLYTRLLLPAGASMISVEALLGAAAGCCRFVQLEPCASRCRKRPLQACRARAAASHEARPTPCPADIPPSHPTRRQARRRRRQFSARRRSMLSPPPAFLVRSRCTDDGCPESVRRLCLAAVEPADALPGRTRTWLLCAPVGGRALQGRALNNRI